MDWAKIYDLGIVAVLGIVGLKLFFGYLQWQSKYLVDRSLDPLTDTVEQFKVFVGNHLEHQQQEHKAIMENQQMLVGMLKGQDELRFAGVVRAKVTSEDEKD
jgi:hypothetical protein